ncbi:hypothetical protein RR48_13725 [Papilio machaon]|uniref:Uncharacterized protein n=1 Tax=Papilio machaon TaxID=76193 RepID=A0A194RHF4_PAPMA|nr:hypothetical protein RR48_13725 [Papilio machaon]
MASDEYQIQNIYRYSRKSFRNHQDSNIDNYAPSPREDADSDAADSSPRNDIRFDEIRLASAGCSCDLDPEADMLTFFIKNVQSSPWPSSNFRSFWTKQIDFFAIMRG